MTGSASDGADDTRRICPACEATYDDDLELCPIDGARLLFTRGEPDTFLGRTLDGRFRIDERIGGGAMGTVYRAWQHSVQRAVAVKIMNPKLGATAIGVRRFLREARLASKLSQPNTVSVLDFGQTRDGDLFLVMELLEGRTLLDVVRKQGALPLPRAVRIGAQLCDALEAAHTQSIVHRDLKPGNIVVLDSPPGRDLVKVLDFGLAKSIEGDESEATMTGQVVGTPRYIAPEIWLGGAATARSDLYALGVILCELVTGKPLFGGGGGAEAIATRIAAERPPLPASVPAAIRPVIEKLLAREPRQRYASAAELRADLVCLADPSSSDVRAPSPEPPASQPPTEELPAPAGAATVAAETVADVRWRPAAPRSGRRAWMAAGALVAAAAAGVLAWRTAPTATRPSDPAPAALAPADAAPAPPVPDASSAPAPPAVPAEIELELRSSPPAKVTVDGRRAGTTPLTLRLPRGDRTVDVVFERPGSKTVRRQVVLDRDRTLEVELPRADRPKKPKYPF